MPHEIGSTHTFMGLMEFYRAEQQGKDDAHYLLYRGTQILALCLRHKYNQTVTETEAEVWVGNKESVDKWGQRLADLKGTRTTVPLYFSRPGQKDYTFFGDFRVDEVTASESQLRSANIQGGPVALSQIVFLKRA